MGAGETGVSDGAMDRQNIHDRDVPIDTTVETRGCHLDLAITTNSILPRTRYYGELAIGSPFEKIVTPPETGLECAE